MEFNLNQRATDERLREFAEKIKKLSEQIGFKVSARGWCYQLETERLINKDEFNKVESWINKCRKKGILSIDFTAEEEGRKFKGVEIPTYDSPIADLRDWLVHARDSHKYYTPNWWNGETYYIQMLVEKVDLKTLFYPVCKKYHIPIATSKGWSSMLQRAEYARRFKEAEDKGLKCVLLYCGDHDPDGLRISETIRKNLADLQYIEWDDGEEGYNPEDLQIERFGLDADFIEEHNLIWIDNLITGSGSELAKIVDGKIIPGKISKGKHAGEPHQNFYMTYLQDYLNKYGVRKCEANAIVTIPAISREFVEGIIINFLGDGSFNRFQKKRDIVFNKLSKFKEKTGLGEAIDKALDIIDNES